MLADKAESQRNHRNTLSSMVKVFFDSKACFLPIHLSSDSPHQSSLWVVHSQHTRFLHMPINKPSFHQTPFSLAFFLAFVFTSTEKFTFSPSFRQRRQTSSCENETRTWCGLCNKIQHRDIAEKFFFFRFLLLPPTSLEAFSQVFSAFPSQIFLRFGWVEIFRDFCRACYTEKFAVTVCVWQNLKYD